tara:strand:- start:1475 stop:1738 length:264 start_codon:yes stop_codon:yes gene_type:complete
MAFKGTLPSDLWLKYNQEGGKHLMELDMHVAIDMNDAIAEAHSKASKKTPGAAGLPRLTGDDAKDVIARRNARREARKRQQQDLSDT